MFDYIAANIVPMLIGASFTCGVAVFYLVMMRTIKHRQGDTALNG
ncbi:hypothetical protein [uncultured Litoreibacter sp.]|nr:hypothetical protein [uncultured Litoreibacter sp.]